MTTVALMVAVVAIAMILDLYEIYKTQNMLFKSPSTQTEEQDSPTETQTQR
jgi:cell division protein FtsL